MPWRPRHASIQISRNCDRYFRTFRFPEYPNQWHRSGHPAPPRDVSRSSRNVARVAMDAVGVRRARSPDVTPAAYGEVVWSWRRDRGVYFAGGIPQTTVTKNAAHRGEHEVSRKAIARGKSGCLGCTCSPCPCASHMGCPCAPAHGIYGRSQRPAFPAPSAVQRDNEFE